MKDKTTGDELRPEYRREELEGGVRGKYLEQYRKSTNLALLAPDVRAAFPTDESGNDALLDVSAKENSHLRACPGGCVTGQLQTGPFQPLLPARLCRRPGGGRGGREAREFFEKLL